MTKFNYGDQLGPEFTCATQVDFEDEDEETDALRLFNYELADKPVLSLQNIVDASVASIWLDRTQVQDLMVVLAYWLQETEDKEE